MKLSICIVTHEPDFHYLEGLFKSLPLDAEILLLETYKSPDMLKCNVCELVNEQANLKHYKLGFMEFTDFSFYRNTLIKYASGDWILTLDSDERLVYLEEEFKEIYESDLNTLGIVCNIVSYANNGGIAENVLFQNVRLFRNHLGIKYKNSCHETVEDSIKTIGGNIAVSSIIIKHLGYEKDEAILPKQLRNAKMMIKDLSRDFNNKYLLERLLRSLELMEHYKYITRQ